MVHNTTRTISQKPAFLAGIAALRVEFFDGTFETQFLPSQISRHATAPPAATRSNDK